MTNYQEYLMSRVEDLFEDGDISEKVSYELRQAIRNGDPEANWKGHPDMDRVKEPQLIPISWVGDTRLHNLLRGDYQVIWDEHHLGQKYLNRLANMDLNQLRRLRGAGPRTIKLLREALDKHDIPYTV